MNETLITKLPSALEEGADFPKLGELRIPITSNVVDRITRFSIQFSADTKIKLSDPTMVFYNNATAASPVGNEVNVVANIPRVLYIKDKAKYYISIENKYNIVQLGAVSLLANADATFTNSAKGTILIRDLTYSRLLTKLNGADIFSGDIKDLPTSITTLSPSKETTEGNYITGTVADLARFQGLTELSLKNQKYFTGNISNFDFSRLTTINLTNSVLVGTISTELSSALVTLNIDNTNIVFDIVKLFNKSNVANLNLSGSLAHGDVSNLSAITLSSLINLRGLNLSGDLSKVNPACTFLSNINSIESLKNKNSDKSTTFWTKNQNGRTYILACESVRMTSGVDQFFKDMATLSLHPSSVSGGAWLRSISVRGSRTSASDPDVATLAGKGVTVIMIAV